MFRSIAFVLAWLPAAGLALEIDDFPAVLAGFQQSGTTDFEKQATGYGFSVNYQMPGASLELLSKVVSDKLIMRLPCRPRSPRFHL